MSADSGETLAPTRTSEHSRNRILTAAAEIAAETGYEGTTISKVTKRSGLPVSSVYWFFKDKDELLAVVVRHSYQEWIAGQPTWPRPPDGSGWKDALIENLRRSTGGIASTPDFLRIGHMLTLQTRSTPSAARKQFLEIRAAVEQTITNRYDNKLPDDVLARAAQLPRSLAQVTLTATEGLFLSEQIDDFWDPEEFVTMLGTIVSAAVESA